MAGLPPPYAWVVFYERGQEKHGHYCLNDRATQSAFSLACMIFKESMEQGHVRVRIVSGDGEDITRQTMERWRVYGGERGRTLAGVLSGGVSGGKE